MKTFQQFLNEETHWTNQDNIIYKRMDLYQRYKSIIAKNIDDITPDDIKFVLDYLVDEEGVIMCEPFDERTCEKPDILKHLLSHFKNVQNESNPITLYRILNVQSKDDINLKRLGKHYQLSDKELRYTLDFSDGWIIKIKTDKKNINLDYMFRTNIGFPNEFEVTLKDYSDYEILDIYET
jgi:hypothetical protein